MNEENTGRMMNDEEMAAVSGGAGGETDAKCDKCGVVRKFIVYSGNRGKCTVCGHMQNV